MGASEEVIGTFLYAASPRNYEIFRLIFTPSRIIKASLSWKKKNLLVDLLDLSYWLLAFPFEGPSFSSVLMVRWITMKGENRGKPPVSYDSLEAEEILKMDSFKMLVHEVSSISYPRIRRLRISANPTTKDYRLSIDAGRFSSQDFLIPEPSLGEFRRLVGKTPLAQMLESID